MRRYLRQDCITRGRMDDIYLGLHVVCSLDCGIHQRRKRKRQS
jgi:hypothetical protein